MGQKLTKKPKKSHQKSSSLDKPAFVAKKKPQKSLEKDCY